MARRSRDAYPDHTLSQFRLQRWQNLDVALLSRQAHSAIANTLRFDAAFVSCDIEKTNSLFTDDIEFYHDKTGLERGQQVRESFRRLTASCPRDRGIRRELVAGTLRVYPIKDYGAVQMGVHRFVERGASTYTVARFVTLWQKKDGGWIIPRVLSFDHLPMPVESGSRPSPSTP